MELVIVQTDCEWRRGVKRLSQSHNDITASADKLCWTISEPRVSAPAQRDYDVAWECASTGSDDVFTDIGDNDDYAETDSCVSLEHERCLSPPVDILAMHSRCSPMRLDTPRQYDANWTAYFELRRKFQQIRDTMNAQRGCRLPEISRVQQPTSRHNALSQSSSRTTQSNKAPPQRFHLPAIVSKDGTTRTCHKTLMTATRWHASKSRDSDKKLPGKKRPVQLEPLSDYRFRNLVEISLCRNNSQHVL